MICSAVVKTGKEPAMAPFNWTSFYWLGYCFITHVSCWLLYVSVEASLPWRHNGRDSVSNHQCHHCLLNRLFRHRSKKTSKLCVTGLCVGNSPGTGEFPAQMTSNAENVSIWWRHHAYLPIPQNNHILYRFSPIPSMRLFSVITGTHLSVFQSIYHNKIILLKFCCSNQAR